MSDETLPPEERERAMACFGLSKRWMIFLSVLQRAAIAPRLLL